MSATVPGKLAEGALASLTGVANGAGVSMAGYVDVAVTISGTFAGTWAVEVSFDGGTTWAQFDTGTAKKLTATLPRCGQARGICSAFTSGTIVMNFSGTDPLRR